MSDTPRTDNHFNAWGCASVYDEAAREFSEMLERELSAVTAERDRLLNAQQWQPVESAPKDVPVLISGTSLYDGKPVVCAATFVSGVYWRVYGCDGWDWENDFVEKSITAWMPLPEPHAGVK